MANARPIAARRPTDEMEPQTGAFVPLAVGGAESPFPLRQTAPAQTASSQTAPTSRSGNEAAAEVEEKTVLAAWTEERIKEGPSWATSLVLHLSIFLVLWMVVLPQNEKQHIFSTLLGDGGEASAGAIDLSPVAIDTGSSPELDSTPLPAPETFSTVIPSEPTPRETFDKVQSLDLNLGPKDLAIAPAADSIPRVEKPVAKSKGSSRRGKGTASSSGSGSGSNTHGQLMGSLEGSLRGRGGDAKDKLLKSGGGTPASERAVALGLEWLARHQRSDGSWSFKHGPDDPGTLDCPTGATGLALLCFLGAGHTHREGEYKERVGMALKYLVDNMQVKGDRGYFGGTGEATMYVQAIDTIALCEAYALTGDYKLREPAQMGINFIVEAQDRSGGGWRYRVPQAGDTSVTGWQIMALKSAKIAKLEVPSHTISRAGSFLKSVESERGAQFGYTRPQNVRPSMTAVGLLCRMYLGKEPRSKAMQTGVGYLSNWGPNPDNMYYSYHGTQVMRHWGGDRWYQWNMVMREALIARQAQEGDSKGSWRTDNSQEANMGGRLYTTCLCILTLEVYYRYLPLFKADSVTPEF